MVAQKWTQGDQEEFLRGRMANFHEHKGNGTLLLFWPKLVQDWLERYPIETAMFPRTKADLVTGTPEEIRSRKIALQIQRLKDWFSYHSRVKHTATGRQETLDFFGSKPRLLQIHHAYSHRYYETKVSPVFEEEYAAHLASLPKGAKPEGELAFKNRILIRMYDLETPEIKAECEAYRRELVAIGKSARTAKTEYEKAKSDSAATEGDLLTESGMRRAILAKRQRNINLLPGTAESFLQMVFDQTKYRAVLLVGGREPECDGKISSFVACSGATSDLSQDFQLFHPDWQGEVENIFTKWLQKCCEGEDDDLYNPTSQTTASEPTNLSAAETPTPAEVTVQSENANAAPDVSTSNPQANQNAATSPVADDDDAVRSRAVTFPTFDFDFFNDGANGPEGTSMDNDAVGSSRAGSVTTADASDSSQSSKSPSSQPVAPPPARTTTTPATTQPQTHIAFVSQTTSPTITPSPPATAHNTNRTANDLEPSISPDELPAFMKEAHQFMSENLNFIGAQPAIDNWVQWELLLGPPHSNHTKISTSLRPDVVEWWYRHGRRNFAKIPELARRKSLGSQPGGVVGWYLDKQPVWRGTTWPLLKDDELAKTEDWTELMKSGNCGFVMILICLTWWGMAIDTVEECREIVSVLEDVAWVLKTMVARLKGKGEQRVGGAVGAAKPNMKRKAGAAHLDVPAPSKRSRNSRSK